MRTERAVEPYLEKLRGLSFITDLDFKPEGRFRDLSVDGRLRMRTPKGTHVFLVELKGSYLDRGALNALVAVAKIHAAAGHKHLLLFARYVPTPSAERLIESGINFVDRVGNIHLILGRNYHHTVIGNKENTASRESKRLGPAMTQLLFTLAADEQSGQGSVRHLAQRAGLGKSSVAKLRRELLDRGVLRKSSQGFQVANESQLHEELLRGYELVLRPKLLIGRFRSAERDSDVTIAKIREALAELSIRWSLTGGPAAFALQSFYRGPELPIWVDSFPDSLRRKLRLLPDRVGPLIFLRTFGQVPFWKKVNGTMLAHPWLIYCELLCSQDPRAHEAAQELRREFLT